MIINAHNNAMHAVKAVFLDGRYMSNVIYADDVVGEVTYNAVDREGYLMLIGDEIASTTDTGHVQIELHKGWSYDSYLKRFIIVRPD